MWMCQVPGIPLSIWAFADLSRNKFAFAAFRGRGFYRVFTFAKVTQINPPISLFMEVLVAAQLEPATISNAQSWSTTWTVHGCAGHVSRVRAWHILWELLGPSVNMCKLRRSEKTYKTTGSTGLTSKALALLHRRVVPRGCPTGY